MTKTLELPQQTVDLARRITHAATDESAIIQVVNEMAARAGDTDGRARPLSRQPTPLDSLYTPEQLSERRRRQADFVKYLGTSDGFMTVDELHAMRAMD